MNYICPEKYDMKESLLPWQKLGLTYAATGYGEKIPTTKMIRLKGDKRWRRVYVTIRSNAGSAWVMCNGEKRFLIG